MTEPTPEIIGAALTAAITHIKSNPDCDLLTALANATTTQQCRGVEGFKVFRDVRKACTDVLQDGETLSNFNYTASRSRVLTLLEQARMVATS